MVNITKGMIGGDMGRGIPQRKESEIMDQKSKRAPAPGIDPKSLLRPVPTGLSGEGREAQEAARRSEFLTTALLGIFNPNNGYNDFQNALANIDYTLADIEKICRKIEINHNTGFFISAAINKIITENDTVTLDFNGSAVTRVAYLLQKRHVILSGPAGDYAGAEMSGSASLTINGNAGDLAGHGMSGSARLTINGSAGGYAGTDMSDSARLTINGSAGSYAGAGMSDSARLTINGSAGSYAGSGMSGSARLTIKQNAGKEVGYDSLGGTIEIWGTIDHIAAWPGAEIRKVGPGFFGFFRRSAIASDYDTVHPGF